MQKTRLITWSVLAVFMSTACLFIPAETTCYSTTTSLQELENKDQIVEAVIRYFISDHATQWDNIHFYLVCLDSSSADTSQMKGVKDPRPPRDINRSLVERLTDLPLPLRRLSQCSHSHRGIFDNESSQRGIMYVVGERFRWIDSRTVQVYVWYFYDGLAGASWTCDLKRQDDRWSITKVKRGWIS